MQKYSSKFTLLNKVLSGSQCFMIGDDVRDDIDGAQKAGIKGILVKTGKYHAGDESKIDPRPWKVADNLAHAVQMISDYLKSPENVLR